ncbi:uncharacterized protein AB675_8021 [Cyphellophora attinorum]|uniref:Uncharacterized protein n=1 Tax=Cyphellophora attinorum TaxID=1664694 RepID=A0A0N1NZU8_9EURO|nr:uncharacterized protein AB675_8021 [Phialophora attinorum]KPI41212.1 hypothetical protein AB675_8021 [Phialophora attinorum]
MSSSTENTDISSAATNAGNAPNLNSHDKPCTLCSTPRPVLVRCQVDDTGKWHFVCPGKCWTSVSGGVEDAKGLEGKYPYYRYGGMWKNKHADGPLSAKKPKRVKERQKRQRAQGRGERAAQTECNGGNDSDGSDRNSSDGRGGEAGGDTGTHEISEETY